MYLEIIIFDQLKPPLLSHVQLGLSKDVLEAFMIDVDVTQITQLLTPFLGTCPRWQDKTAVFCLQGKLPMRMVADQGELERG